jgi:phosphatidate phosphatase APP1
MFGRQASAFSMGLKNKLTRIASGMEDHIDDLLFALRRRMKLNDPLQIVTYRTYGTVSRLYIKGRVLEDKGVRRSEGKGSLLDNLINMYRRFESDEIPGAEVKISFQGKDQVVITDREGYFVLDLIPEQPVVSEDMWFEVDIELLAAPVPFSGKVQAQAEVLIPPADAEYGVISDIDDTIVRTGATNLIAMSRNTFFHNAHSRLPFAGVSEFYKALMLGRNGKRNNPFFYVSSSPWNLYELLRDFMDLNNIPEGPLLLRDFGLAPGKAGVATGHMGHKFKEIENIFRAYPGLNFVLIGDSGQEDPAIYLEVVKKYPDRVLAVYIRDVQLPEREKIAIDLATKFQPFKVEMVIVDSTVEAAEHAAKSKIIFTEAIENIVEDKKQDKGEVAGKEAI